MQVRSRIGLSFQMIALAIGILMGIDDKFFMMCPADTSLLQQST